jgi:hypothetical protein
MVRIVGLLPQAERNTLKIFAVTGERGYKNISELKDKGVIKTIQGISRTGEPSWLNLRGSILTL